MGIILKSESFDPNGKKGRDHNLEATIEGAGYEVDKEPELPDDRAVDGSLPDDQRLRKNIDDYSRQVTAAQLKYGKTEWDSAVNQEITIGTTSQLAILEHENAAEIVFHLGQHPDEARRLGKMTPLQAAAEVGRLSDRLPKPQRATKPVRPAADATFAEIAAAKNYPGKIRDLKRASRR